MADNCIADDSSCSTECIVDSKDEKSSEGKGNDSVKTEILSLNEQRRRDWRTFKSELERREKCRRRKEAAKEKEEDLERKAQGLKGGKSGGKRTLLLDDTPKSLNRPLESSPKPVVLSIKPPNKSNETTNSSSSVLSSALLSIKDKGSSSTQSKKAGKRASKSKTLNASKSKKNSRGRSIDKTSKKSIQSKSQSRADSTKRSRGRSRSRVGKRKPRGPPPTPISYDGRKSQSKYVLKLEKFNKARFEADPEEANAVDELRGYNSEPELEIPCQLKFVLNNRKRIFKIKSKSVEDLFTSNVRKSKKGMMMTDTGPCYDEEDFAELKFSQNVWSRWQEVFEMEKNRFSFFDELWARRYITDSMEVPRYAHDISYLIEADSSDYSSKNVDYSRVVFKTKNLFTGNMADWYFQGPGRYSWLQGEIYQGEFANGVPHGEGIFLWPNGSIYEGNFYKGHRKGWGIHTMPQGYTYCGEFADGVPHGQGKVWYNPIKNTGDFYDGEFLRGLLNGFGTRQYNNGDRYVGFWLNGLRHGKGTMYWKEQWQMYKGDWKNGMEHGDGLHVWFLSGDSPSSTFSTSKRYIFKGEYQNGARHGSGLLIFPNRSVYQGYWENGKQVSTGKYIDPARELLSSISCDLFEFGTTEFVIDRPTYECVFRKLIQELKAKSDNYPFDANKTDDVLQTEERELTNVCLKYLDELQLLYKRAGALAEKWSNHSLTPKWTIKKRRNKCFSDKNRSFNKEDFENIFANGHKSEPDDSNLLTRLGLWLLLKDCPGLTSNVTMAHFDKKFVSTMSICFQTKHNPFEPMYFWQFLQCLIVVAFEVYVSNPVKKKKTQYKTEGEGSLPKTFESGCEDAKPKEVLIDLPLSTTKVPSKSSLKEGPTDKGRHSIASKKSIVKRRASVKKHSKKSTTTPLTKGKKSSVKVVEPPAQEPVTVPDEDQFPSASAISITSEKSPEDPDHIQSESDIFVQNDNENVGIPEKANGGIAEIFERLLNDILVPCFERVAGKFLPDIPNPLPPLVDLFKAFKSIKNEETITAVDFLYSVLPHQIYPDKLDNQIYWQRSKQLLSPFVNYDYLFQLPKQPKQKNDDTTSSRRQSSKICFASQSAFSESINNSNNKDWTVNEFPAESQEELILGSKVLYNTSSKPEDQEESGINEVSRSRGSTVQAVYQDGEEDDGEDREEKKAVLYCDEVIAELNRKKEEELKPKPTALEEFKQITYDEEDGVPNVETDILAEQYPRDPRTQAKIEITNTNAMDNLDSDDVITILRYMYPELCGGADDISLNFDMIFPDWLFCVALCSHISIEKERELTGKVKSSAFRLTYTKNTLDNNNKGQMEFRGSTQRFFRDHVLSTFIKHQEIRRGDKWTSDQCGGGGISSVNQNLAESSFVCPSEASKALAVNEV